MKCKTFIEYTGLSKKTALWLYDHVFSLDGRLRKGSHRNFTDEDIEWVLDRQYERFSKIHNIKQMDEAEDLTYIEDTGDIYSYKRGFMEKRKLVLNTHNGYLYITLWKNGANRGYRHARLVGKYFVNNENPNKFNVINHIDGNKTNDHPSNLEWTDISGNTKHAFDNKLIRNASGMFDSQSIPILVEFVDDEIIHFFWKYF